MIGRIKEFIDSKGLSVSAFEQSIEASDGMIRRAIKNGTDIQSKWIARISDNYPDLSLDWLVAGKGPMLRDERPTGTPETIVIQERDPRDIQLITTQDDLIKALKRELQGRGFQAESSSGAPSVDYPCTSSGKNPHHK